MFQIKKQCSNQEDNICSKKLYIPSTLTNIIKICIICLNKTKQKCSKQGGNVSPTDSFSTNLMLLNSLAKSVSFTKILSLLSIGPMLELSIVLMLIMHVRKSALLHSQGFWHRKRLTTCTYHITRVGILLCVEPSSSTLWKITTLLPLCFHFIAIEVPNIVRTQVIVDIPFIPTRATIRASVQAFIHTFLLYSLMFIPMDTHHTNVHSLTFLLYLLVPLFLHLSNLSYVRSPYTHSCSFWWTPIIQRFIRYLHFSKVIKPPRVA